jgi:dTDP-4-dehydrorhamnose reductase
MKILVLGADGMLGYQALQYFQSKHHDVSFLVRKPKARLSSVEGFHSASGFFEVDVRDSEKLETIIKKNQPDAVLNCIGIVKQRSQAKEAVESIEINALLPHRLAAICAQQKIRLVHYSTDCVFSGNRGHYKEDDVPDATDYYGRSKLLGELDYPHTVTLRTSIIGLELFNKKSLVEWYLSQKGPIKGYKNAIYSGFTTLEMCRITEITLKNENLGGIYQVASTPISKFDLLNLLNDCIGRQTVILEEEEFHCDRSLIGTRFYQVSGYTPPSWQKMISELAEQIRGQQ